MKYLITLILGTLIIGYVLSTNTSMTISQATKILDPYISSNFKITHVKCNEESCYGSGKLYIIKSSILSLWKEPSSKRFVFDITKDNIVTIQEND